MRYARAEGSYGGFSRTLQISTGPCSFVLIISYTLRIPITYYYIGQGIVDIGGILVTEPETPTQMCELTQFDIN